MIRALAVAAAVTAIAAAPAQGASYPAGGSDFVANEQGWSGSGASCTIAVVCTASNVHDSGAGNPPGSIATRVNTSLNFIGLFTGSGTWTSPSFTVPAGQPVAGATFAYDRQFDPGPLVNLGPLSTVNVRLVDETAGSTVTLLTDDLTTANAAFAPRSVSVPNGVVVPGHAYRLSLATSTSTTAVALGTGDANTRFDNVVLAVDQGSGGGGGGTGGDTPTVSDGVRVVRGFRSGSQITALFARYDESAEVGRGPGGSLVAMADCTIIGTPRADRIKGTRGNDVICGLGGNDRIDGAGGKDLVDGGNGNDRVAGGSAKDKLIGLRGKDRLNGNAAGDRIGGGAARDRVIGGKGGDRLIGGRASDRIAAGAGKDRILARDRTRDVVDGGKGRDRAKVDRLARSARRTRTALRRVDRVRRVERKS